MEILRRMNVGKEWSSYNMNNGVDGVWYEEVPQRIKGLEQSMKFIGGKLIGNHEWHGYGAVYLDAEMKGDSLWIYLGGSVLPSSEEEEVKGFWILNGLLQLDDKLDGREELWEGDDNIIGLSVDYTSEDTSDYLESRIWDVIVVYVNDEGTDSFVCVGSGELKDSYRLTAGGC